LLVIDVADRPRAALEALGQARRLAPDALCLVIDPRSHPGLAPLAEELGATCVLAGDVPPPAVAALLTRWLALSQRRSADAGWAPSPTGPAEPWERLAPPPARQTAADRERTLAPQ
jgi:hypothetical protein